jgi:hypothetical protein
MSDFDSSTDTHEDRPMSPHERRRVWREEMREYRCCGPFRGLFWGLLLVLVGVLALPAVSNHLSGNAWAVIFLSGLGAIFIIDAFVRSLWSRYFLNGARIFVGAILIGAGILVAFGFSAWWPVLLLILGFSLLLRPLFYRL